MINLTSNIQDIMDKTNHTTTMGSTITNLIKHSFMGLSKEAQVQKIRNILREAQSRLMEWAQKRKMWGTKIRKYKSVKNEIYALILSFF